jgi:hypothetical protein
VYDTTAWKWKKYNSLLNTYTDVTALTSVTVVNQTVGSAPVTKVTFTVVDGGIADEDGIANAIIVDPVGPAIHPVSTTTPIISGGGGGGGGMIATTTLPPATPKNPDSSKSLSETPASQSNPQAEV